MKDNIVYVVKISDGLNHSETKIFSSVENSMEWVENIDIKKFPFLSLIAVEIDTNNSRWIYQGPTRPLTTSKNYHEANRSSVF